MLLLFDWFWALALGLFPPKHTFFVILFIFIFIFFYCISSNALMKPWVSQWLWALSRLHKPHTHISYFFLAHRLSRLPWDADEKVIQEVGAASEAEHRVRQLEGKVGRLAQLAGCEARTGQDINRHIWYLTKELYFFKYSQIGSVILEVALRYKHKYNKIVWYTLILYTTGIGVVVSTRICMSPSRVVNIKNNNENKNDKTFYP